MGRREPAHRRHARRTRIVRVRRRAPVLARALRAGGSEGSRETEAAQEGPPATVGGGGGPALLRSPPPGAGPDPGGGRRPAVRGERASARGGIQGRRPPAPLAVQVRALGGRRTLLAREVRTWTENDLRRRLGRQINPAVRE